MEFKDILKEHTDAVETQISALNKDERTGPDPDTFNYVPA